MKLGWIGLGVMGGSMCTHLLRAGYPLTVHTRTRAKAAPQIAAGAAWADSARAVALASDVVFTMVGFPSDVREVVLGEEGVLAGLRAGGILVDMTTSEPALAVELAEAARARGAWAIDAPVSGGDVGAREARLSIMVGGHADALAVVRPALETLGRTIVHQGGPGSGQHTKMVNQTLIASNMIGVCEAMLYAQRAGLDPERVLESVSGGAAGSWSLANLAPRLLKDPPLHPQPVSDSWGSLWQARASPALERSPQRVCPTSASLPLRAAGLEPLFDRLLSMEGGS